MSRYINYNNQIIALTPNNLSHLAIWLRIYLLFPQSTNASCKLVAFVRQFVQALQAIAICIFIRYAVYSLGHRGGLITY